MSTILAGVLAAAIAAAACGGRQAAGAPRVRVAAAADLRFALDEMTRAFDARHPGRTDVRVEVTYGSSGNFFAQIVNGAPFDLFLSADQSYPRELTARGLTRPGSEFTYAFGRIVVWVPKASALDVEHLGLSALASPQARHVAIANPEHAPYGRAAVAALRSAGVYDAVAPKLALGENVSQAFQFVQTGAADAGIVALALAVSPSAAASGRYVEIPPDQYPRLEQRGAILRSAADPEAADLFRSFLTGPEGRALLARYGFSLPEA